MKASFFNQALRPFLVVILLTAHCLISSGKSGYALWLDYTLIANETLRAEYQSALQEIIFLDNSEIGLSAKGELLRGLKGLLNLPETALNNKSENQLVIGLVDKHKIISKLLSVDEQNAIEEQGFIIEKKDNQLVIAARDSRGLLYGCFRFLQWIQQGKGLDQLPILENPLIQLRILNHWDNLDGTVERGYAGFSIWDWHQLPEYIDQRYIDYARANASIGINGAVVTNVNANALIFRHDYLEKAAALAKVFRKWGIRLYLTARFNAPIELGELTTADPLSPEVREWWKVKAAEIYQLIPDFGGFLVKANSEGQPGPQYYGRNHADGANLLAEAVAPHGGVVMWRAFVYSDEVPEDRAKQAFQEFQPLDGQFHENVMIQIKNGPIDFQPREPYHPLFTGLSRTSSMMEFQITKEYLGQGSHLVGLASMYEEILQTDTYLKGEGSTLAKILDGSLLGQNQTGIAGVSNIGTDLNWTGHLFGQADWYAFGRFAWNPHLRAKDIFREWSMLTFPWIEKVQEVVNNLLNESYEACVQYMTPLGLHHIMGPGHHYGPGPWVSEMPRADWTSTYYHNADDTGIGFDRTESGSDALSQYPPEFASLLKERSSIPNEYLLWFHHVGWDEKLRNGRSLWDNLCLQYQSGVDKVKNTKQAWLSLEGMIDEERFQSVLMHLTIQEKEAIWWKDACISYFQEFSKMPLPPEVESPAYDLEYYQSLTFPYAPGIKPRW